MKNIFALSTFSLLVLFSCSFVPLHAQTTALYGMTQEGGANNDGTIFEYIPASDSFIKLFDFDSVNGELPYGDLMQASNGLLYGLTAYGGDSGMGVLFVYDPTVDTFLKLVDFDGAVGEVPQNGLIEYNGSLYGVTQYGGTFDEGTLFSYNLSTGNIKANASFDTLDGGAVGYLLQVDTLLYGLATGGGNDSDGVIFKFNPADDSLDIAYAVNIDGVQGSNPLASLIMAANGKIYGTTVYGGAYGNGVIFKFDPVNNQYQDVYDFDTLGIWPSCTLLQLANGQLYGTTPDGGTYEDGTIYSFDTANNSCLTTANFDSVDGAAPVEGLILSKASGLLYGMTSAGGSSNYGVIYSYNTSTDSITKLVDLSIYNGTLPSGHLLEVSTTTGISKVNTGSISIYPNPATSELTIHGLNFQPGTTARITDMEGRVLMSQDISGSSQAILNVGSLTNGLYLIQVTLPNGVQTQKFVKEN